MKLKSYVMGLIVLMGLSLGGITVYNQMKPAKPVGDASMSRMDMGKGADSMSEIEMSSNASKGPTKMDPESMDSMGSMNSMDMGQEGSKLAGYSMVQLDARKQQLIGVKTETAGKRTLKRLIRAYGVISHDTDLYSSQQEYISAYQYYRSLTDGDDSRRTALVILDAARKKLIIAGYSDAQIKALAGRGKPDDSLIEGGNSTRTWVYAQIYPNDLPYIQRGQRVRLSSPQLPGKNFYGVVDSLDTVVDPGNQSVRTRILAENSDGRLSHQGFVNAKIEVPIGTVLALPEEAVIDSGGRQIAFVDTGNGYFEPRELAVGRRAEGFYEVISGVKAGEKVVSAANFFIDSESQLKSATDNMGGMKM